MCLLPVCVTSDPAAARASAEKEFAIYGQLPSYRAMLDREGAAGPGDVAIVGDEGAVAAQILALADAGVTDFVPVRWAWPLPPNGPLEFICQLGTGETRVGLDAQLILDAAQRSIRVWPGSEP